jgi:ribosome-associated translation inhibitor RaiA
MEDGSIFFIQSFESEHDRYGIVSLRIERINPLSILSGDCLPLYLSVVLLAINTVYVFNEEKIMQIQINTDRHIHGNETLTTHITNVVESGLVRFRDHITRVEVHLTDVNGDKSGPNDKRCVMEARLERHQPIAVTHQAAAVDQAVDGAIDKLVRLIESTLDRQHDQKLHRTDPSQSEQVAPKEP